jgi:hypothetical protein
MTVARRGRLVFAARIAFRTRPQGITAMAAHDTEPSRSPRGEPGRLPRGVACAGHVFAAHVRTDPGLVWTALTDPGQTAAYLYGPTAHSTWVPGDPIEFRLGGTLSKPGRATRRCEPDYADSPQDAEEAWLPVLAALQLLVNPA